MKETVMISAWTWLRSALSKVGRSLNVVQEIGSCLEDRGFLLTRTRIWILEWVQAEYLWHSKLGSLENRWVVMMILQRNEGSKKTVDCLEKEGEVRQVRRSKSREDTTFVLYSRINWNWATLDHDFPVAWICIRVYHLFCQYPGFL